MQRTETHFEQVPKPVIEKMLAEQNATADPEKGETAADEESASIEDKALLHP